MHPTFHSDPIPKRSWFAPLALLGLLLIAGCGLVGNDDKKPRLPGTLVFSALDESGGSMLFMPEVRAGFYSPCEHMNVDEPRNYG